MIASMWALLLRSQKQGRRSANRELLLLLSAQA
jgi:hypothetical protein